MFVFSETVPAQLKLMALFVTAHAVTLLAIAVVTLPRDADVALMKEVVMTPYATSALVALMGVALIAAAVALLRERMWGWAPVVVFEIILIGVGYYLFTSGHPLECFAAVASALITLNAAFSGPVVDLKRRPGATLFTGKRRRR